MSDNVIQFPARDSAKAEPAAQAEKPDSTKALDELRAANQSALKDLMSRGMGLNPLDITMLRIETLYEYLLGSIEQSSERRNVELAFELKIADLLKEGLKQVFAAQLTAGVNVGPSQLKGQLQIPNLK
jgi:hypothetical protein